MSDSLRQLAVYKRGGDSIYHECDREEGEEEELFIHYSKIRIIICVDDEYGDDNDNDDDDGEVN